MKTLLEAFAMFIAALAVALGWWRLAVARARREHPPKSHDGERLTPKQRRRIAGHLRLVNPPEDE